MSRFFYTFGSDKGFPYRNGWVEVVADSWEAAHRKFRSRFPDRHPNCLNCSFFYDEEQWRRTSIPKGIGGYKCYEVIDKTKFCIAVQEILRKEIVVEAETLEEAERMVQEGYNAGRIVLDADDLVEDPMNGERCNIIEADWYAREDVQKMEVTFHEKED